MIDIIKTEEEFFELCWPFADELMAYVQKISGNNRWWFDRCYKNRWSDNCTVTFKSYITPEYRNFSLAIAVTKVKDRYEFSVNKQVTDLA